MQVSVKKELRFEYAHRLLGHKSKCQNCHGHNARVWVYFRSKTGLSLDELGMVIDFNDIKQGIGQWIDDNLDHALILHRGDEELTKKFVGTQFKTYLMDANPTAENMAIMLLNVAAGIYKDQYIEMYKVEVFENDFSAAVAKL